ncbi:MAG: hypothetical protein ACOX1Y_12900 [Zhaonellaceae bacterium]
MKTETAGSKSGVEKTVKVYVFGSEAKNASFFLLIFIYNLYSKPIGWYNNPAREKKTKARG